MAAAVSPGAVVAAAGGAGGTDGAQPAAAEDPLLAFPPGGYWALPAGARLRMLRCLCFDALETRTIRRAHPCSSNPLRTIQSRTLPAHAATLLSSSPLYPTIKESPAQDRSVLKDHILVHRIPFAARIPHPLHSIHSNHAHFQDRQMSQRITFWYTGFFSRHSGYTDTINERKFGYCEGPCTPTYIEVKLDSKL